MPLVASWERLGGSRGRPGSLLGASWSVLRGPAGALRASWGLLVAIFFGNQILNNFWIDLGTEKGAQREAFWEPKWGQSHAKNEVENEDEKKTLLRASWVHFGSFWGASWDEKTSKSIGGASISWKMRFWKKTSVQGRFWHDLGSKKPPKGTPRGTQNEPKTSPK